jgi:biopolymer transport protein ExbB
MFDTKTKTPFIALLGALALAVSAPAAYAQPATSAPAASAAAPASGAAATEAPAASDQAAATGEEPAHIKNAGKLTIFQMILDASLVAKVVMGGLAVCSVITWTLFITKLFEFGGLNRSSDRFLEAFRGARSIADMGRIASSEDFEGNPMADMAAAAAQEVELSRQAGLQVGGAHRDSTILRAQAAVSAVQANLAKRLSSGMIFFSTIGSSGPFIGLFGTVYGIMVSFIGIANTNTTNLAVVAPGIAEALLATALGLFAAIPSVVFYNIFQTRITAYGTRSEGFVAELMNAISRQLDKGA